MALRLFPPACRRRSGFSLVEVLIAMAILSIGATSLIALFAAASSAHKRAIDRTNAALVADEVFSEVQSRYTPGIDLNELLKSMKSSMPEKIDGYYWQVSLHQPGGESPAKDARKADASWAAGELVVRVVIRWSMESQSREESYATILLPRARD